MPNHQVPLPKEGRPLLLKSENFVLRVQTLEDNEKDYAAVMAARDHLRNWSGDAWPESTFTLTENKEDLAGHIEDAAKGFSFGYTVWSSDGTEVLGSVYLYPSAYFAGRYHLSEPVRKRMLEAVVSIDYWLRPELEAAPDHARLLMAIGDWLRAKWGFCSTVWPSRPGMGPRRALYEAFGMSDLGEAKSLHTPGWRQHYHLWEETGLSPGQPAFTAPNLRLNSSG